MKPRAKKVILYSVGLFAIFGVAVQSLTETTFFTSYLPRLVFNNNFAPVVESKIYRSAEMDRATLTKVLTENKIKTVIDLRAGKDDPDEDGFTEDKTVASLGLKYLHIPFFASRIPPRESVLALLDAYRNAEQPVLVHCSSGTHRSGVAAALWLLDQEKAPPSQAADQLSAYFGYFPLERQLKTWIQGHPTLDAMVFAYLKAVERESITFREWAMRELPSAPSQ